MIKEKFSKDIEIKDDYIKIDGVTLCSEAIEVLQDLQDGIGDHFCRCLTQIADLLTLYCDDMPIEYDETIHLLQAISNLRSNIRTLIREAWPPTLSSARLNLAFEDAAAPLREDISGGDVAGAIGDASGSDSAEDAGMHDNGNQNSSDPCHG